MIAPIVGKWLQTDKYRALTSEFSVVVALAALSALLHWGLQPRIGIIDSDAYTYIVGAYSIQSGNGFVSLAGESLNHFPPGYSLFLSLFSNPIQASQVINYFSFGVAVALVYHLARRNGWSGLPALSLAVALGFGFLRSIAINAAPDILTYALFLLAVLLYTSGGRLRLTSYFIWSALVPFKYIALVFTPAALIISVIFTRLESGRIRFNFDELIVAVTSYAAMLGSVVLFNFFTIGTPVDRSYDSPVLSNYLHDLVAFPISILRQFLLFWYSPLTQQKWAIALFLVTLLVAIACLITLRPEPDTGQLLWLGLAVVLLSLILRLVREFDLSVRLTGYGLLVALVSLRPIVMAQKRWLLYALLSVSLALGNILTVNALGSNDPRYELLAQTLAAQGLPQGTILTNSYHILDIQIRHPTAPIDDLASLNKGNAPYFLWVTLPNYDGNATIIRPLPRPSAGWCNAVEVEGAVLFHHC